VEAESGDDDSYIFSKTQVAAQVGDSFSCVSAVLNSFTLQNALNVDASCVELIRPSRTLHAPRQAERWKLISAVRL